jgi:hypothetical protein
MKQRFSYKLLLFLCLLNSITPALCGYPSAALSNLLNQLKVEAKPKSSVLKPHRAEWLYSATAKPLSLAAFPKVPLALQQLDAFAIKAAAPIALGDLLSSNIQLQPGDQLNVHSLSIHLKQAHLKAHGKIKYLSEDDWVGKIFIEAQNVDKCLDELLKSGAFREPQGMALKFILSGFTSGIPHTSSKSPRIKISATFKDKMLWIEDLPVCPISMLLMKPDTKEVSSSQPHS